MTPPEPIARLAAALADRYRIERELGTGGMATVYLAQDSHGNQAIESVLACDSDLNGNADIFVVPTDDTRFFFNTGQHQADIRVADVVTQP